MRELLPLGSDEAGAMIHVHLTCPSCGHTWHAASIEPGAWWAEGLTPQHAARQCYCVQCNQGPPMLVAGEPKQTNLAGLFS